MKTPSYCAVILAGGLSSRMPQFKPLLPLGDSTVVETAINLFHQSGINVILVGGHRYDELFNAVKLPDITKQPNHDYEQGMMSSVRKGLECITESCRAFFILPVDIPLVRPATVRRLIEAHQEHAGSIVYPTFKGRRGHPTLIPADIITAIMHWEGKDGLKGCLQEYHDRAIELPVADKYILTDIDTELDYRVLTESYRFYAIPDADECDAVLNDIFHVDTGIIRHGQVVAEMAGYIAQKLQHAGFSIDDKAIKAAALLHDMAKGQHRHDEAAGEILRSLGFEKVADIVSIHTDLIEDLSVPSLETRVVYLADKLVRQDQPVSLEERYATSVSKFGNTQFTKDRISERKRRAFQVKHDLEQLIGSLIDHRDIAPISH